MSRAQIAAVAVTCLLCGVDGYDVLSVSFAAPGILKTWGLSKAALGLVLSSGLVGAALGSFFISPLADVIGRRYMVIATVAIMALGMAGCGVAHSVSTLATWRVLTGVGIGAMVPIMVPLAAEFSNDRRRTLAMGFMSIGYPIGGVVGGAGAALLLNWLGWRSVFLFGAAFSLLMLPVITLWLPEPLAFLLERRDADALARVNALLRRFGHVAVAALPPPSERASLPYREIFSVGQRAATLRITTVNLLFFLTNYYVLNWMPQLVADAGFSASTGTGVASLASLGGAVSCILVGIAAARIRVHRIAATLSIGLGVATALFGNVPPSLVMLAGMAIIVGLCLYGGTVAIYTLVVETFEPRMRATGVGLVMGIGRVSGALAPAIAGSLFGMGAGRGMVSVALGAASLLAGLLVLLPRLPHDVE